MPTLIERCSETRDGDSIGDSVDVALVHLAIPRRDLAFRPIGPVRGPLGTFRGRVRGFSRIAGPYTGPVAEGSAAFGDPSAFGGRVITVTLDGARVAPAIRVVP
jgi:hypothetical protein